MINGTLKSKIDKLWLDFHSGGRTLDFVPFCANHLLDDKALEAFVDAHLKSFDVNDDIGMKIKPTLDFNGFRTPTMGLGVTIPLNRKAPPPLPVAR